MQEDKFLENLAFKMIKAVHKKNDAVFASLKSVFLNKVEKDNNKNLLNDFNAYQDSSNIRLASYAKEYSDKQYSNKEIEYLKNALKVDKCARAIENRWENIPNKEKVKFLSIKLDDAELGYKYSAKKFADTLESKRLDLQKNGIFVSREAYYELIKSGYKAENITKNKQGYILPVWGKKSKLVFNSESEFKEYIEKHERNFNSDIDRIMEC